jgi:hypothetical protein
MTRPGFLCLLLSLGIGPFAASQAADKPQAVLYRYVDSRGVMVLDRQGVPPEYVANGYEILNAQGRVVEVVPPAPSAEEIRDAQAARVQAAADAQLLSLYGTVDDLDRARNRQLAELDGLIAVAKGNIQNLDGQQRALQSQAADLERAGKPVPQSLVDQMDNLRDQQHNLDLSIQRNQQTRLQTEAAFERDRARMQRLRPQ